MKLIPANMAIGGAVGGAVGGILGAIVTTTLSACALAALKSANVNARAKPLVLFTAGATVVSGVVSSLVAIAWTCFKDDIL